MTGFPGAQGRYLTREPFLKVLKTPSSSKSSPPREEKNLIMFGSSFDCSTHSEARRNLSSVKKSTMPSNCALVVYLQTKANQLNQ